MAKRRMKRTSRKVAKRTMRKMTKRMKKPKSVKKTKKSKKSKKATKNPWQKHIMEVYKSMKAKDPSVKLGDAMKAAGKTYNKDRPLSMSVEGGGKSCAPRRR